MNLQVHVRLDLSPALESAILTLARALGGRSLPPLQPYEAVQPNSQKMHARDPAEPGSTSKVAVAVAPAVSPTAPKASPWTPERNEIVRFYTAAGLSVDDILPKVNACEGPEVSRDQLRAIISYRKRTGELPGPTTEPLPAAAKTPAPLPEPARSLPARPFPAVARTTTDGEVSTDDDTIRQWAAQRGLCNGGAALDLERINAKRVDLGLPPFVRRTLQHSGATMRPGSAGAAR